MTPEELSQYELDTRLVHLGSNFNMPNVPIYTSVTIEGKRYARNGTPTSDALEQAIADMEGAKFAMSTGCGIAAISLALQELLDAGDLIVCHKNIYDWATTLIHEHLPRTGGNRFISIDFTDLDALKEALKEHPKIVYFESISNPMTEIPDMQAVIDLAHEAGAKVVIDNTFAPMLVHPLSLGADVLVYSMTKYICGHGDALGGVVLTNDEEYYNRLNKGIQTTGGVLNAFPAYLIARGLKTLPLRMERHCQNAMCLAQYLSTSKYVESVLYPGLPSHPNHEMAKKLLHGGYGGIIGVTFKHPTREMIRRMELGKGWVSLGDTHTLLYSRAADARRGTPENYVRISVGIEEAEDLIKDLERAMTEEWGE